MNYFYEVYEYAYCETYFYKDFDNALEKAKYFLHESYVYGGGTPEEEEADLALLTDTWFVDGVVEINKVAFED